MHRKRRLVAGLVLPILLLLTFSLVARGQGPERGAAETTTPAVAPGEAATIPAQEQQALGPTDPAELEAFLDELMANDLASQHIAGAAVAVVKDGRLFFTKGYGYADVENAIPVDPEQTIFRIGSIGKVFTWTAVMQLVEQGRLDLDADINTYLDFRIPDTYPEPITLKHLLTHTSGFEDRWMGSATADASQLVPARDWLIANSPGRVRPPGEAVGYSNYNAMLAGYIVSRVSGEPYDRYIQEHILKPLGMARATAESPVPAALRPFVSVGYTYEDGAFRPFPDFVGQPAALPSGGHLATVTDMARFMIAHLENGRYSDATIPEARILEETTTQQMHSTLYTPDPRLLGTAYGLFDMSDNGQRTLGHSGYSPPMHSELLLLPDQHLGVFVAYNSAAANVLTAQHTGFQRAFFDHYYPAPASAILQPPDGFAERAGRFTGLYRSTSAHITTPERIIGLFGTYEIGDPGDGTLLVTVEGLPLRFVEVEPLYFHQVDGPFALVFREDGRGRVTSAFTDLMPQYGLVKLAWYETPGFNIALLVGCVLVFLSVIPVAAIRLVQNRRLKRDRPAAPRGARVAYWTILAVALLNLLFVTVVAMNMPPVQPSELHGISLTIELVMGVAVAAAVLTIGALVFTVIAWKDSYWSAAFRAFYTLVTIAAVAFVWFLNYWNWLGWRY